MDEASPTVSGTSHLTLHYRVSLREPASEVISTFGSRPATIQMGGGQLAPALEAVLIGMREGESRRFELTDSPAYGERQSELVQSLSRGFLDRRVDTEADGQFAAGDVVALTGQGGERVAGVVKSIDAERVVVDLNHPLAGQDLIFEVELLAVL